MISTGLKRDTIDKYYTSPSAVQLCLSLLKEVVPINESDTIIEPSAGSGAFYTKLKQIHPNTKGYDLLPEADDIEKQDFLTLELDPSQTYHFVGNPPFGRQSTLAKKFIQKACMYGNSVSFILPKSFKKESFQKVFPRNFHLKVSLEIPSFSFHMNGSPLDVPCVFQIWVKEEVERNTPDTIIPTYWKYVKKEDNPNIAIRRIGGCAGRVSRDIEDKNPQCHYFLKLSIDTESFISQYESIAHFDTNNTVGPRSISKQELNRQLIKINN